jgi:hypothetical protein
VFRNVIFEDGTDICTTDHEKVVVKMDGSTRSRVAFEIAADAHHELVLAKFESAAVHVHVCCRG